MGRIRRAVKWVGYAAVGAMGATAVFDVTNDYVVSRSARAIFNACRIGYLYKTTNPETREELSELHRTAAKIILDTCIRNEGLYIKMGQQLHAINHILPEEYLDTLKVLLDSAPTVPLDVVRRVFFEETGRSFNDVFVSFDETPVASASIAQVHKATMKCEDGRIMDVAVKLQKPQLKKQIWWDLQCYLLVCRMLQYSFQLPLMWSATCVAENMIKEIDFRIEASNSERSRAMFAQRHDVYIPEVFPQLLTSRLIISEWVDAVKLLDVQKVQAKFRGGDVMQTVLGAFAEMVFLHGFVHCDPHPANLMVRPNKNPKNKKPFEVVIIDFGLCIEESKRFRLEYSLLFKSMVSLDRSMLKAIVSSWGVGNADLFASLTIQKPFTQGAMRHGAVSSTEIAQMELMMKDQIKSLLAREELIPKELVFVGRAMNLLRSVNKSYGAPVNRINLMAGCAVKTLGHLSTLADVQDAAAGVDAASLEQRRRKRDRMWGHVIEMQFQCMLTWIATVHLFTQYYNAIMMWVLPQTWADALVVGNLEEQLEKREKDAIKRSREGGVNNKIEKFHKHMNIGAND